MAKTRTYSLRLPKDAADAYRKYGDGNMSAGIQRLAREKFGVAAVMGEPYFQALARKKAAKSRKSRKKLAS